eukprot:COSAG05_NODE_13024_length_444_cov_1.402899_1_plen_24_part_01
MYGKCQPYRDMSFWGGRRVPVPDE